MERRSVASARRTLGWWIAGLVALLGCEATPDEQALAHLRRATGTVTVEREGVEPTTGAVGQALSEGDIIATGADGAAAIEFAGGNVVELNDNSRLVVRRGATAELGAVLLGGTAQISSRGEGLTLSIGTPFGQTQIGQQEVQLEVGVETGIKVLVGSIVVEIDGAAKTVAAGNGISVGGLVVPIGAEIEGLEVDAGTIELDPIVVTLLGNNRQVQVRRAGTTKWQAPKRRDTLGAGDALRTRRGNNTLVQLGDGADLTVGSNSVLELGPVGQAGDSLRATYTLQEGNARVRLRRKGKQDRHEIVAGGNTLTLRPGPSLGDVEISQKKGRVRVEVRLGTVSLQDGTVIEAGTAATLGGNAVEGAVQPLATTAVDLRPRSSTEIHYLGAVPPLAFTWPNANGDRAGDGYAFEVARDRDFQKVLFNERVSRNAFVYDRFEPGRYFWRVGGDGGNTRGTFVIQKHKATECANCKRVNYVDDNGEKTVIYYQQKLPALTFRWKQVPQATSYRLQVFADGSFDKPAVDEETAEPSKPLRAGRLTEGKYFWLVKSYDGDGKEVRAGSMNSLEIAYDNAVTDLVIQTPRHGQRVAGGRLTTTGTLQIGARLWIDGKPAPTDEQGRFRQTVALQRGLNRIYYRSLAKDGIERFYVRDVIRR